MGEELQRLGHALRRFHQPFALGVLAELRRGSRESGCAMRSTAAGLYWSILRVAVHRRFLARMSLLDRSCRVTRAAGAAMILQASRSLLGEPLADRLERCRPPSRPARRKLQRRVALVDEAVREPELEHRGPSPCRPSASSTALPAPPAITFSSTVTSRSWRPRAPARAPRRAA